MTSSDPRDDLRTQLVSVLAPYTGGAQAAAADAVLTRLDPMPAGWWCDRDFAAGAPPWQGEECPSPAGQSPCRNDVRLWLFRGLR